MSIFPYSRMSVGKGRRVWVYNPYTPTTFGIRGKYESVYRTEQYIEDRTPGTGFFVRQSSSQAYRSFVIQQARRSRPSYLRMLLGKDFSFSREIVRAESAAGDASSEMRRRILEAYANCLRMGQEVELNERVMIGIKGRSRHLSHDQKSAMSRYKSSSAEKNHDVRSVQLHTTDFCSEERYRQFRDVVKAFANAAASHRLWSEYRDGSEVTMHQVFFDLGIFDFIQAPLMTPMLRDAWGRNYFLYPDFMVCSRDAVDFDVIDLRSLTFDYQEVAYDLFNSVPQVRQKTVRKKHHRRNTRTMHVRRDYDRFGAGLLVGENNLGDEDDHYYSEHGHHRQRIMGQLSIPELGLVFYTQDNQSMFEFVDAMKRYQSADVQA